VPSEMPSCHAISLLRAPAAAHWATSRSRGESAFSSPQASAVKFFRVVLCREIHGPSARTSQRQDISVDPGSSLKTMAVAPLCNRLTIFAFSRAAVKTTTLASEVAVISRISSNPFRPIFLNRQHCALGASAGRYYREIGALLDGVA